MIEIWWKFANFNKMLKFSLRSCTNPYCVKFYAFVRKARESCDAVCFKTRARPPFRSSRSSLTDWQAWGDRTFSTTVRLPFAYSVARERKETVDLSRRISPKPNDGFILKLREELRQYFDYHMLKFQTDTHFERQQKTNITAIFHQNCTKTHGNPLEQLGISYPRKYQPIDKHGFLIHVCNNCSHQVLRVSTRNYSR